METRTAMRKLTFDDGLPLGERAMFTHNDERWICIPLSRYTRLLTACDLLIGGLDRAKAATVRWLAANPGDIARAGELLAIIANQHEIIQEANSMRLEAIK